MGVLSQRRSKPVAQLLMETPAILREGSKNSTGRKNRKGIRPWYLGVVKPSPRDGLQVSLRYLPTKCIMRSCFKDMGHLKHYTQYSSSRLRHAQFVISICSRCLTPLTYLPSTSRMSSCFSRTWDTFPSREHS
ncbi:hypothetical protein AVEN_113065-1 [Araneus ventricosus]|uniref:Uncharacterized protein n=1 Tax=Araneus ventricosus TaxID=182803 RepID=A0A4Y2S7H6_ARAVE|nr:hypothetical protein AVEN_113065-1 [Araneus ventricosus]